MSREDKQNVCLELEKNYFSGLDNAKSVWLEHSQDCPDCKIKLLLIEQLQSSTDIFDFELGTARKDELHRVLVEHKTHVNYQFVYKFAAAAALLIFSFMILKLISSTVDLKHVNCQCNVTTPIKRSCTKPKFTEWNYVISTKVAKRKLAHIKNRKRREQIQSTFMVRFKRRCESIKSKTICLSKEMLNVKQQQ